MATQDIDYSNLGWVRGELELILKQAGDALEAYAEDQSDTHQLQFCVTHIHQVRSILQMLELFGAAMLAEEIEGLGVALVQQKVQDASAAVELLMRSVLQLADYLEAVQHGQRDIPMLLLPQLNDLRASYGKSLLSELAFFSPNLDKQILQAKIEYSVERDSSMRAAAKKLRPAFQLALLGWFKSRQVDNVKRMLEVLRRVQFMSMHNQSATFWFVCSAVVEGVALQSIKSSAAVNLLMGQIDRQLKLVSDIGDKAFVEQLPTELLRNLLFYLAQATPRGKRVCAIQQAYGLQQILPSHEELEKARESLTGPATTVLETVSNVLKEDIMQIKDGIDLLSRSAAEEDELEQVISALNRVGDTMGMLGFGATRSAVKQQTAKIAEKSTTDEALSESELMELASLLLSIESQIDDAIRSGKRADNYSVDSNDALFNAEYRRVEEVVVKQCLEELASAKESLIDYSVSQESFDLIEDVPSILQKVQGALAVMTMDSATKILDEIHRFVSSDILENKKAPSYFHLEAIAEALSGLEYQLETIQDRRVLSSETLANAELSVARLREDPPADYAPPVKKEAEFEGYSDDDELDGAMAEEAESSNESMFEPIDMDEPSSFDVIDQDIPTLDTTEMPVLSEPVISEPEPLSIDTSSELTVEHSESEDFGEDGYQHPEWDWLAADADEEIIEVFCEEAEELIENSVEYFDKLDADINDQEEIKNLRRSFHTLKGSGRLAGSPLIGEIYYAMESLFNSVLEEKIAMSQNILSLAKESYDVLPKFVARIAKNTPVKFDPTTIIERANALAAGKEPTTTATNVVPESDDEEPEPAIESSLLDINFDEGFEEFEELSPEDLEFDLGDVDFDLLDVDDLETPDFSISDFENEDTPADESMAVLEETEAPTLVLDGDELSSSSADEQNEEDDEQTILFDLFNEEAAEHLQSIKDYVASLRPVEGGYKITPELQLATHTLAGAAQTANVGFITRVSRSLDQLIQLHNELQVNLDDRDVVVLTDSVQHMELLLKNPKDQDQLQDIDPLCSRLEKRFIEVDRTHQDKLNSAHSEEQRAESEEAEQENRDDDLLNLFFAEAEDTLQFLNDSLLRWKHDLSDTDTVSSLQRALHTLKGGARMTGYNDIAQLSGLLEQIASEIIAGSLAVDAAKVEDLQVGLDHLAELFEYASRRESPRISEQLLIRLQTVLTKKAEKPEVPEPTNDSTDDKPQSVPAIEDTTEDVDQELVAVFMEEAVEVLDAAETELQKWKATPSDMAPVESLQRLLHTLKGGARMAGFVPIGNLSHQMESCITLVVEDKLETTEQLFDTLEMCYDRLHTMVELASSGRPLGSVGDLVERLSYVIEGKVTAEEESEKETEFVDTEETEETAPAKRATPVIHQDAVRISAKMIDRLVNYAGEISIYRSRFEQQLGAIGFNLVELEQTVFRLREQLRRLEIEAEAQILYRYEESRVEEEFDPLEFDRFSQVQQLSRSLAESVSDLANIQGTLTGLSRESEVLLVQQARLNTELQENLMRSRMVPFSTLVPRLRRIVRQTAHELNKKAELKVVGTQGEMDRTVLDRVTAPLEHMLRNALAHGIESAAKRKKANKDETGIISVRMYREGSEVVLRVGDDGAGMNIEAIRKKAIQRNLLEEGADLTDKEVMQFVLQSGFSTADNVSQISGRGVGMDVVNNEIKQMGGVLEIDSIPGKGTSFTARLPFTLAVNQALLVQAGPETYAIPLASIEGVVRLSRAELKQSEDADNTYLYAGFRYQLLTLDYLLGVQVDQDVSIANKHIPLLLVQAGEHRVALQIDGLMGSREVVVKSAGPQLSTIQGIMGATILGDGRVVLILDIVALTRVGLSGKIEAEVDYTESPDAPQVTAMVVDDSITVRKATKRLLERNNMKVVLAKDGVDAIAKLNEVIPDVMLLDVEMPRMDGFELAMHVRRESALKDIPIIMITSRSGEKHRRRAFDIGVNKYLGKPYQETDLMDNIVEVLGGNG